MLDNPGDLEEDDMSLSRYERAVRTSLAERGLCVVFQVVGTSPCTDADL
jgi:hypothetical protein